MINNQWCYEKIDHRRIRKENVCMVDQAWAVDETMLEILMQLEDLFSLNKVLDLSFVNGENPCRESFIA